VVLLLGAGCFFVVVVVDLGFLIPAVLVVPVVVVDLGFLIPAVLVVVVVDLGFLWLGTGR
jgi:hypothetical protein